MEHRGGLHDDRARDEEDDRREVEHLSPGPEQAHEGEQEEQRGDRRQRVEDLPDPLRMVEPEGLAELDRHAADREEPGRRVVAPGAVGKPAVANEALRVLDRLGRVVARDRGIDGRVADGDHRGQRDHREGCRPPYVSPRAGSRHGATLVPLRHESRAADL